MLRLNKERRRNGETIPRYRTNAAVPNNPPKVETEIAVATSNKLSFMSLRRSYIEIARLTTAGPSINNKTSPAPIAAIPFMPLLPPRVVYVIKRFRNDFPDNVARTPMMAHMLVVHTTNG
jgi:hypothetical protein